VLKNSGNGPGRRFRRELQKIGPSKINDLEKSGLRKTGVQTSKLAVSGEQYRSKGAISFGSPLRR
jgi:hypothetical protein